MKEKTEYKNSEFRPFIIFKNFGFLLIINTALIIFYFFFISSAVNQRIEANLILKAVSITHTFSFFSIAVSAVSCAVKYRVSVNEYHIFYNEGFCDCKLNPKFSLLSFFISYCKKNGWLSAVSYLILIIPGMLFCAYAKMTSGVMYSYESGTLFDRLIVTSIFGPEVTGSIFWGMLLDTVLFFAFYACAVGFIQYAWSKKFLK